MSPDHAAYLRGVGAHEAPGGVALGLADAAAQMAEPRMTPILLAAGLFAVETGKSPVLHGSMPVQMDMLPVMLANGGSDAHNRMSIPQVRGYWPAESNKEARWEVSGNQAWKHLQQEFTWLQAPDREQTRVFLWAEAVATKTFANAQWSQKYQQLDPTKRRGVLVTKPLTGEFFVPAILDGNVADHGTLFGSEAVVSAGSISEGGARYSYGDRFYTKLYYYAVRDSVHDREAHLHGGGTYLQTYAAASDERERLVHAEPRPDRDVGRDVPRRSLVRDRARGRFERPEDPALAHGPAADPGRDPSPTLGDRARGQVRRRHAVPGLGLHPQGWGARGEREGPLEEPAPPPARLAHVRRERGGGAGGAHELLGIRDFEAMNRMAEAGQPAKDYWILTFDELLSTTEFPAIMSKMLKKLEAVYDYPVDIEFTANFNLEGKLQINLLQCRPFQVKIGGEGSRVKLPEKIEPARLVFRSHGPVVGHSLATAIDRLIYVVPAVYSQMSMSQRYSVARLIGRLNHLEKQDRRPTTMLVGPGRWGTSMPSLGVPVSFAEINTASVICELTVMHEGLIPDVSLGPHFFNDLVEMDILSQSPQRNPLAPLSWLRSFVLSW